MKITNLTFEFADHKNNKISCIEYHLRQHGDMLEFEFNFHDKYKNELRLNQEQLISLWKLLDLITKD
jgi:hypothetical protein